MKVKDVNFMCMCAGENLNPGTRKSVMGKPEISDSLATQLTSLPVHLCNGAICSLLLQASSASVIRIIQWTQGSTAWSYSAMVGAWRL